MSFFKRAALRDGLSCECAATHNCSSLARARLFLSRWMTPLLAALAAGAIVAPLALAGTTGVGAGRIAFYGGILDIINSRNPLLVRPSSLLLTEDGSVALVHLRWRGWGTSVARASGVWSASSCTPSCATGKLTNRPTRLTLSSPGLVGAHLVYRCFQISPPHPKRDVEDHACIDQKGRFYSEVSVPTR